MAGRKPGLKRAVVNLDMDGTYWLWPAIVDPDFDCMDEVLQGLTLGQIRDPIGGDAAVGFEDNTTFCYSPAGRRRVILDEQRARYEEVKTDFDRAWRSVTAGRQRRMELTAGRFTRVREYQARAIRQGQERTAEGDWKCRRCVPYNGSHTVNYWGRVGQVDPW